LVWQTTRNSWRNSGDESEITMVLKNKDGTTYKVLSEPNPILESQDFWSEFEVHNLKWNTEKFDDKSEITQLQTDFEVNENSEPVKPEPKVIEPKVIEPKVIEKPVTIEVVDVPEIFKDAIVIESESGIQLPANVERTIIYCLPAITKEHRDMLYGEVKKTIKFGKPFSFEGVVIQVEDLGMNFWTSIPHVTKNSIIYPRSRDKRWWKVSELEDKTGGYLIQAVATNYHPSF